ncbi:MAG: type II toxin-antitoxin system RelE/ParE family toxin [Aminobacteriaceae bacterium]
MSGWSVEIGTETAKKIQKLGRETQHLILTYINRHLRNSPDPRASGKALTGPLRGLWRYSIGDYRLLAEIRDDELIIVAVDIGHRSAIYSRRR